MVDNIHLNKISHLLSSTERVKRVDRRPRDRQQPPDKGNPQEKQKKKNKNHPGSSAGRSEATPAMDLSPSPGHSATHLPEEETSPPGGRGKRIIDIRI